MKKAIKRAGGIIFGVMLLIGCGNEENAEKLTSYEIMESAFVDYPTESEIKPMMESVMKTYSMQITEDNLLKVANMLVSLRKNSKVGVTEMDILKHIYQNKTSNVPLAEQAAISFTYLEMSK